MNRQLTLITVTSSLALALYILISESSQLISPPPPDPFYRVKGGSWLGYRLGHVGSLLILAAQVYSIVKRLPPKYWKVTGGRRTWLKTHVALGSAGSVLVLIHSGLPFSFKYADPLRYLQLFSTLPTGLVGSSGLATWFLLLCLASGLTALYLSQRSSVVHIRCLRYWRTAHILFGAGLYLTGLTHLILVAWFKLITI